MFIRVHFHMAMNLPTNTRRILDEEFSFVDSSLRLRRVFVDKFLACVDRPLKLNFLEFLLEMSA